MSLRFVAVAVSVLVAAMLLATMAAAPASLFHAATEAEPTLDPKFVTGKVWKDSLAVEGAAVNVSMYDGAVLRSYYTDTTDSTGSYIATFGGMGGLLWAVGDTIRVVAESGIYRDTNTSTATSAVNQQVNVTLTTEIPEFGQLGPLLPVLGALGMFMAVFFVRRAKGS